MKRKFPKPALLVAAVGSLVLVGVAFAFWTSSGTGQASATVANPEPVTLSPGELTGLGFLYPGTSTKVSVKISNPNPFPVNVPSLVLDTTEGYNSTGFESDQSGCDSDPSELSYITQDNGGNGWTVPAGPIDWTVPLSTITSDAVTLSVDAANECQNASFKVFLRVGTS